jgi:hypothetical protein
MIAVWWLLAGSVSCAAAALALMVAGPGYAVAADSVSWASLAFSVLAAWRMIEQAMRGR